MPFASITFATFFLLVATLAWTLRGWRAARNGTLLLASAWFYAAWDPRFLALLFVGCLLGYFGGEAVSRSQGRARVIALWATNLAFLALLGSFKYYDFFRVNLEQVAGALGLSAHLPLLHVVLPAGISFYTFQGMSYVIDIHRGHGPKARSFVDFALFLSFFPKLIAGPICRSRDLLPQIEADPPQGVPDLSRAVSLIASGLFKKVVVATYLQTHLVDGAFSAPENHSSLELLLGLYAYSMQVYADFSGYTDIAIGCALLLGFHLPENFNRPYAATSIGDFWRRWHITYSTWLRDYVYFSLGGSRTGRLQTYFNLMITFLLGGFWHGARWGYVAWGGIHGLALVVHKITLDVRRARGREPAAPSFAWVALSWLATFHVCVFARVFFRARDLEPAWQYLEGIFAFRPLGQGVDPVVVVLCVLVLWMNVRGEALRESFVTWHERLRPVLRPPVWLALAVLLLALKPGGIPPYIYFAY